MPCVFYSPKGFCIQAEASQQAARHKAQAEAQGAELQSLYRQLADHKQAVRQHPWAGTAKGIARLPLPISGMLPCAPITENCMMKGYVTAFLAVQFGQPATGFELR